MAAKVFFVFCASVLLGVSAQCIGSAHYADDFNLAGGSYGYANSLAYGAPYGVYGERANAIAPSNGGGFPITSVSPISPTGIKVVSENAFEGGLSVVGELPFLSAVAFESALPTAGAGSINYGCGNGAISIVSEGIAPAYGPAAVPAAGLAPGRFGYGAGIPAPGFAAPGLGGVGYGYNGFSGCGAVY